MGKIVNKLRGGFMYLAAWKVERFDLSPQQPRLCKTGINIA